MQPAKTPARLIIGYGNPLRGDDGVGWHVSKELAAHLQDSNIEILPSHQLAPELAEKISRSRLVLFIDATCEGSPGEWTCNEIRPDCEAAVFSHVASPSGLLQLARSLYGDVPPAWLFTVCGNSFGFGEDLSPAVRECLPELVTEIVELVTAVSLAGRSSPAAKCFGA
jgi:hydrogenase maturation protease